MMTRINKPLSLAAVGLVNSNNRDFSCVCFKTPFLEIEEAINKYNYKTTEEVKSNMGCGGACGLCIPYIEQMVIKKQSLLDS